MQSCRFFSPDLFMKNSNFSKTVRTIFIKFCSHSTPKGAPACSKASKSYDWNVRNIAKISLKMAKISPKTAIFQLFLIFAKTVNTIRTKISSVIFYTIVWSMCAISINSYNWDWSESEGKRPEPTPLPHMRLWLEMLFRFFGSLSAEKNRRSFPQLLRKLSSVPQNQK